MRVVICGGVIGACTAYFLARRGVDVTVIAKQALRRRFAARVAAPPSLADHRHRRCRMCQ
jgi:glycine/D-amino acid oxidase-like deaminating enzyme